MKHKLIISISLFFISFSTYAIDDKADGNTLMKNCQAAINIVDHLPMDKDYTSASSCFGYIKGFSDMNTFYEVLENKGLFCIPQPVTLIQKTRVVVKYLKDNPNKLHKNEAFLVYYALKEGFPCD